MNSSNKNTSVIVWGFCVLVSVVLRTYELASLTESQTGFMKRETEPVGYALLLLIGLIIVLLAMYSIIFRIKAENINSRGISNAIASFVLGGGIAADYLINGIVGVPAVLTAICSVLQVLTAVYFISNSICIAFSKKIPEKLAVISLMFYIVKSAAIFIQSFYHSVISDTVFDVAAYSFIMLFFLEFVRLANGMGYAKSSKKVILFGFLGSALCIIAALPKIFVAVFLSEYALHDQTSLYLLPLTTGIFIAVCTFSAIKSFGSVD